MSWLYRFFKKSDDEQTVTVTAPAIQLTGNVTVTGALTTSGGVETEVSELVYWQTVYNTATIGTLSVSTLATTPYLNVTDTGTIASIKGTTAAVTGLSTLGYATVTNTATIPTLNSTTAAVTGLSTLGYATVTNTATIPTLNSTTAAVTGLSTLGYATVTNTATAATFRNNTSPLYLGTGTLGIFFGSVIPTDTGVTGADKGSLYLHTGGTVYIKNDFASTSWSAVTVGE